MGNTRQDRQCVIALLILLLCVAGEAVLLHVLLHLYLVCCNGKTCRRWMMVFSCCSVSHSCQQCSAKLCTCTPEQCSAKLCTCTPEQCSAKLCTCTHVQCSAKLCMCTPEQCSAKLCTCTPEQCSAKLCTCTPATLLPALNNLYSALCSLYSALCSL